MPRCVHRVERVPEQFVTATLGITWDGMESLPQNKRPANACTAPAIIGTEDSGP